MNRHTERRAPGNSELRAANRVFLALAAAAVFFLAAGCAATDVVAHYSALSFGRAAEALGSAVEGDFRMLKAPGGEEFLLSVNPAAAPLAVLSLDASPFLEAGMDPSRLPSDQAAAWTVEGGRLTARFRLGSAPLGAPGGRNPRDDARHHLDALAASARDRIGYHAQGDHYGIALGGGAAVEWAADLGQNERDWLVILDPGMLSDAGVDPAKVRGWTLARVPMDGPDGRMMEVEKLVVRYNLR
ncbi:MAG TPA: hypothetical protein VLH39_05350 [Magnetospirillaceae bacterium]|nr:hypothetical protein [Magnetospirillaceae bacterium]